MESEAAAEAAARRLEGESARSDALAPSKPHAQAHPQAKMTNQMVREV